MTDYIKMIGACNSTVWRNTFFQVLTPFKPQRKQQTSQIRVSSEKNAHITLMSSYLSTVGVVLFTPILLYTLSSPKKPKFNKNDMFRWCWGPWSIIDKYLKNWKALNLGVFFRGGCRPFWKVINIFVCTCPNRVRLITLIGLNKLSTNITFLKFLKRFRTRHFDHPSSENGHFFSLPYNLY